MIDTNKNGYLDKTELRTVAAMVHDSEWEPLNSKIIEEVESNIWKEARQASKVGIFDTKINFKIFIGAKLTLRKLLQGVFRNMDSTNPKYEISPTDQVTFAMIHDNATIEISRFDGIRARRTKFICFNDDMKNPSKELLEGIDELFSNFFPFPSRFELPSGKRNSFTHLDRSRYRPNDLINALKKEEEEKKRQLEKYNIDEINFIPGNAYTSESYAWWILSEIVLILLVWIIWKNRKSIITIIQLLHSNNWNLQNTLQANRQNIISRNNMGTSV